MPGGLLDDAYEWLLRQRGVGAPLAARINEGARRLAGPHLSRGVKPIGDAYGLLSMGADMRDMKDFSASSARNFQQGNFGGGLLDLGYAAAAPLGVALPGSVGAYREVGETLADSLWGIADDVDPSMPRRLMPNEMRGPSDVRPARENLRTVVDSNTVGGRVSGDEVVPIETLSGGPSVSARGQGAVDNIVKQMQGPDGYIERLIVDQDGNVIEGAHRLQALRRLGVKEVPVTRIVDPTARLDTVAMGEAIRGVGKLPSDNVNQIISQVGEMLSEVGGDPARVLREYEFPKGFERHFRAALDSVRLPSDEASRMARAREMGFDMDRPLYRGTTEKGATKATPSFEAGDGIFLSDNPDVAEIFRYPREYGEVLTEHFDEAADEWVGIEPGDLQTLYARMQNPMRLTGDEAQRFTHDTALQVETIRRARAAGHDSILVEDVMEGVGDWQERGTTVVALKPVRAKEAKFDPTKKDSSDILAGVGGTLAAGSMGYGLLDMYEDR